MRGKTHCLEVWGDLACFTRPEMKVERYSYPVITPSAARGIFDAIYWKKSYDFYWQVEKIEVLAPPRYIALRRDEVKDKAPSHTTIMRWANGEKPIEPIWADAGEDFFKKEGSKKGSQDKGRTQRQTMALKDVRYRLHAHLRFRGKKSEAETYDAQFERRASQGKCFYQPYLGCREFPAYFELADPATARVPVFPLKLELGWMLYDVFDLGRANDSETGASISVFPARVENGVMVVPPFDDPSVKRTEGANHA